MSIDDAAADPFAAERAELARRIEARRHAARRPAIPRRDTSKPARISPAQWRLWFLEQLRPGTNTWNTPVVVRLRGAIDAEVLRRSLEFLVHRHHALRTVFPTANGHPAPTTLEPDRFELLLADGGDDDVEQFVEREMSRPFDLERDVMLRAGLLRLAADDCVLVLVAHHIACDGWSKRVLLSELGWLYDALHAERAPVLPALPIDYADYAAWQYEMLSGDALARLTAYWREQLASAAPSLDLPTDNPRPCSQAFRGGVVWLHVSDRLTRSLARLGREERATPFMTFLAGFNAFLSAWTSSDDILVGSPSDMRTETELEPLVGLFANTLVYRTSLAGAPTFRELVHRVRDTAIGVYSHQDLPFDQIVQAVNPPRDLSRNPLVQVDLRVQGPEPELRLKNVAVEGLEFDPKIARFDLAVELSAEGDGYAGYLEYDSALYEHATAERIAADFVATLEVVAAAPDAPIAELLSQAAR